MHKIKIVEAGWAGYTGILGSLIFENGISTTVPTKVQADQFGVVMKFVEVDEQGEEIGVLSANADLIRTAHVAIEPHVPMKSVAERKAEEAAAEAANPKPKEEVAAPDPMPATKPADPAKVWTRAELEAIADAKGINGLRVIGTPLGARNTSISKLIEEILQAQAKAK